MKRIAKVVHLPATFHAEKDHIVAVIPIGDNATFGLRFESPEHLMTFFHHLLQKACVVWPDNPLIQEYLSDDEGDKKWTH